MNIKHFSGSGRAWVLLHGGTSSSVNGSWDDNKTAKQLHEQLGHPIFYYRLGNHTWVVDDPKLIHDIEQLLKPGQELVARQMELAGKHGDLGGRLTEAGVRLGQAGISSTGWPFDKGSGAGDMASAQAEMNRVAEEQRELGRQQQAVGQEQAEETRRADAAIDKLMEDAIVADVARELT